MEKDGQLPFLDIDIYRRQDDSLSHKVYRKPTHSNLYLNTESHYHLSKMQVGSFNLLAQGQSSVWYCVGLQPRKISSFLRPVKDELGLGTTEIYSITCECGHVYIGQTDRTIQTRIKEHHRHIRLGHPDQETVAELRVNHINLIKFEDTRILCAGSAYTSIPSSPLGRTPFVTFPSICFLSVPSPFRVPTFCFFILLSFNLLPISSSSSFPTVSSYLSTLPCLHLLYSHPPVFVSGFTSV